MRVRRSAAVCVGVGAILAAACASAPPPPVSPPYQPEARLRVAELRGELYRGFRTAIPCMTDPDGVLCRAQLQQWTPEWCATDAEAPPCILRARLVREVIAVATEAATDPQVVGQAVFALTRDGDLASARSVVQQCRAEAWWCTMLEAHLLAEEGDLVAASAAFERTLAAMPEERRCVWTDLSPILPDAVWRREESPSGRGTDPEGCLADWRRSEPLWWLADPAWTRPGNEARVAWLNRMTWTELHDDQLEEAPGTRGGTVADGSEHSRDHHRDVLRRGPHRVGLPYAWQEATVEQLPVFPAPSAILEPHSVRPDDWNVESPDAFRVPIRWGALRRMSAQVAFLERGDSLLVMAAAEHPPTPLGARRLDSPEDPARLLLQSHPGAAVREIPTHPGATGARFFGHAPRARHLTSIEVPIPDGLAVARVGQRPLPDPEAGLRLSDLVLFEPSPDRTAVPDLHEIGRRMRGSRTWTRDESLGLYLEVYGSTGSVPVDDYDITISLEPLDRGGLLRRLGSAVGLIDPGAPRRVVWSETPGDDGLAASWTLDLSDLEPGRYRLAVRVRGVGGDGVVMDAEVDRRITISEGGKW